MGISLAEAFGVFDNDGSGFITVRELEEGLRTLGVFEAIPKEQVRKILHMYKASTPRMKERQTSSVFILESDFIISHLYHLNRLSSVRN